MSRSHDGWDLGDLQKSGYEATAEDIARNVSGKKSSAEVSATAPETEQQPATTKGKKRGKEESPEVIAAKQQIIAERCKFMAKAPYSALAVLLGDESFALDKDEEKKLAAAYVTLSDYYGWEGTSALFVWGDVLLVHASIMLGNE
jgi:hypothetical protein